MKNSLIGEKKSMINFSKLQLNEGREATEAAVDSSEKAKTGGQIQRDETNRRKTTQKSHMAQQTNTPVKSDVSYASEQYRAEREYIKMMEAAKSDWKKELYEAAGVEDDGNHPYVDVMPFMNQKAEEAKKQMKAAAGAAKMEGDKQAKMAEEVLNEEELNELNRLEKEQGKKSGGSSNPAYRMVAKQLRDMQGTPKGQQKKVKGKKPPVAGEYGAPKSPAQKLSLKKRKAQDFKDQQTSRFD